MSGCDNHNDNHDHDDEEYEDDDYNDDDYYEEDDDEKNHIKPIGCLQRPHLKELVVTLESRQWELQSFPSKSSSSSL